MHVLCTRIFPSNSGHVVSTPFNLIHSPLHGVSSDVPGVWWHEVASPGLVEVSLFLLQRWIRRRGRVDDFPNPGVVPTLLRALRSAKARPLLR
ncbi:hypothetical protein VNO77_31414 [Canavalia gladiata]|uniref:Uncharacterized protein n=1 Tax=Canavalia gladiata TaxID=3824 RepID=A0AAN9KQZ0_CANGL